MLLAAGHDAAVQMIDTSVVRVHQHGACIADNNHQDMGRSRGGLTSKIHAVVDTNGLPVHLALTPGEAHDNRLCSVLLSALLLHHDLAAIARLVPYENDESAVIKNFAAPCLHQLHATQSRTIN